VPTESVVNQCYKGDISQVFRILASLLFPMSWRAKQILSKTWYLFTKLHYVTSGSLYD